MKHWVWLEQQHHWCSLADHSSGDLNPELPPNLERPPHTTNKAATHNTSCLCVQPLWEGCCYRSFLVKTFIHSVSPLSDTTGLIVNLFLKKQPPLTDCVGEAWNTFSELNRTWWRRSYRDTLWKPDPEFEPRHPTHCLEIWILQTLGLSSPDLKSTVIQWMQSSSDFLQHTHDHHRGLVTTGTSAAYQEPHAKSLSLALKQLLVPDLT